MINGIINEITKIIHPIAQWVTERGVAFLDHLVAATIIFAIGAIAIRVLSAMFGKLLERRIGKRHILVRFFVSVIVKSLWAVLIVVVLDELGVQVGPLIAGLGATGFILGFAFQESLGSLAAGMMLALNQPFKLGDFVQVAGFEGVISHLDMMAVELNTADNRRITIPNKQAWGSPIVNYSALELRRVDIAIGIAYGADIAKARETAVKTLAAMPAVLADPAPMAEVISLDDSAVALTCRAWVKNADYWNVYFAANQLVKEAFDRNGIAIPFPQLDVHFPDKQG